jgi:Na+/proline symporter/signal transduction histidine kinase
LIRLPGNRASDVRCFRRHYIRLLSRRCGNGATAPAEKRDVDKNTHLVHDSCGGNAFGHRRRHARREERMVQGWAVLGTAFLYLLMLFAVASYGDRRRHGRKTTSRPNIYAFSLAIYCTTWTFFGSVGLAASSGLSFLAIYLGPIAVIAIGYPLVTRIVRLSKEERITSVADFLGARYGKSMLVAGVATVIAVVGTVPYIALQLKAVSNSVSTLISHYSLVPDQEFFALGEISILIAVTLALFTILFGTRHADATEHQDGLMLAVALESVVKLAAFLAVGIYTTFFLFNGIGDLFDQGRENLQFRQMVTRGFDVGNFAVLTLLSAAVFLLLPRQFHVAVVENHSQGEIKRARWLFPLYLVLINLFVVPIATAGLVRFGTSVNPDDFVLLLPTENNADVISMFAFIGGLSAGAAMVVVACVALAIMISNDLVLPIILRGQASGRVKASANMEQLILRIRRSAIMALLFLAYAYYRAADNSQALAAIGLVSFAAIAQLAPAFFGGLIWSEANARGAIAGMCCGFLVWGYTLLLPTLLEPEHWLISQGPLSSGLLRPSSLFDLDLSPLTNGVLWSLLANTLAFVLVSSSRQPSNSEQAQAAIFVSRRKPLMLSRRAGQPKASVGELTSTVARYLGKRRTERAFESYWREVGVRPKNSDIADQSMLIYSEQLLASTIGASSSRLVHTLLLKRFEASSSASIKLLDEASEALRYSRGVLQTAFEQLDHGITVFDAEFRLSFWNRQFRRLLNLPPSVGQAGLSLNEVGRQIVSVNELETQLLDPGDLADRILNLNEPWLLALRQSERIVEIRTASMPGGGVVVTWHDITERILVAEALREANETLERRVEERTSALVQANRQLEQATRAADEANNSKTRFLAAAGHDIMQPLNAARLYASTLTEKLQGGVEEKLTVNIGKSLESVEDILGAVLAISRLDTGRQETKLKAFPVQKLIDQMEVEFGPFARERGIELRFVRSSAWICSDSALLSRMVRNLVSNAIKYTPRGKVLVGCRRCSGRLRIAVHDTGIGIDESDRAHIFTEFHRLKSGSKYAPGLGLGLSIVDRIARVLDHPVTLNSVAGKGTCFSMSVPLTKVRPQATPDSGDERINPGQNLDGLVVLSIDNEIDILEGMNALLSQWGCRVHTATDSQTAIEALSAISRRPDILLADYHLEAETGIEAIERVRAWLRTNDREVMRSRGRPAEQPPFPCVLVTADRSPALRSLAEQKDVAVLNKPVRPAALRAVLSRGNVRRRAVE